MNTTPKGMAWCYLTAIFVVGMLAGGVTGGLAGYRFGTQHLVRPPAPETMAASVKQRLAQDLRLSPEQQQQVSPIVDHYVIEMNEVHSNTVERAINVIRDMHQRVGEVLTPGQRDRLQQLESERESEFRRAAHPPGR